MKPVPLTRVILFARLHRANQGINETLQRLVEVLTARDMPTFLDEETAAHFQMNAPVLTRQEMGRAGDVIVVVGGDGSLLSAARLGAHIEVPVIGINRGRLGFLTDISPHALDATLSQVLDGHFHTETRFLLSLASPHADSDPVTNTALNDIVLSRASETHLIAFDVYINQQFVSHYRADGLIIATPTGSTAYALSAGGPIMHPDLNALVIVPLFSHSLSSRPLVVDANVTIEIKLCEENETPSQLSCDGHAAQAVYPGQTIIIKKSVKTLRLLHPEDYHYYDTLRLKLGWGSKPQG
jgi:NAD+ kinase